MNNEYKRLDFKKLTFKPNQTSTQEALKNVTPFPWKQDVLDGRRKITISRQK